MGCDFDEIIPRRGTGSYKWDSTPAGDVLPMWVADMDFRTAPCIVDALRRRVEHGIFGYTRVAEDYYRAVSDWFSRRHGWAIPRQAMLYTSGVVPALSAVIKALAGPGDGVLVLTPVYNCFFSSIRNNGCRVVSSPLIYENHSYRVDFADLEQKASLPGVKMLLLCNPHNPACRAWTRQELERMGQVAFAHGLWVVSDEIHCELVFPPHRYTPFASLGGDFLQRSVTCLSPSKAFNTAGLQMATIVAADADARRRIDRAININEVCDVNPFGPLATQAAYSPGGEAWLRELLAYLWGNYELMLGFCRRHLPSLPLTPLEATYLVWMDCRALRLPSDGLEQRLTAEARLWLNAGTHYGPEGEGFLRWNIACPRSVLREGLERFRQFVEEL